MSLQMGEIILIRLWIFRVLLNLDLPNLMAKRENFILHLKEIELRQNFRTKSLSKFNKVDKKKSY